jgi:hypothetical protein
MKSWFEGDFEGFKKTLGNAYFNNVVAYITRQHQHKKNKWCEGIPGVHEAHTYTGNITLAHPYESEKNDILKVLLTPFTDRNGQIFVDLFRIEKEFIRIHKSMIADGSCKFLCPPANNLWSSKPRDLNTTAMPVPIEGPINLEKLQVELIFSGLTNVEVLAEVRKIFPGRASLKTVAYYRNKLKNNNDPCWDLLRAGRSGASIPRG